MIVYVTPCQLKMLIVIMLTLLYVGGESVTSQCRRGWKMTTRERYGNLEIVGKSARSNEWKSNIYNNIVLTRHFFRIKQSNQCSKRRWVERDCCSWVVNDQILQWRQNGVCTLWLVSKFNHWKNEIQRNKNLINHD